MNKEQKALLQLISISQFDSSIEISLDDIDINALYKEAKQQSVLGLIASVIPQNNSSETWLEAKHQQELSYIRYCYAQDDLIKVLDKASIPFVILKGSAAASNYKNPIYRSMGDIDFLVPQERFSNAKEVLISNGYTDDHDNNRHLSFKKDFNRFEMHRRYSHEIDIEEFLIKGLSNPIKITIDGHSFTMLPKLANGLVLLDHMRHHLKIGLGLRQVIDWMMYVYHNLDDSYWKNEFQAVAREKGMETLAITVTKMCQIYLGLPKSIKWCETADENICEQLLECLLISGNFGYKNGTGNSIESVSTKIKQKGLFHWLQYAGEHNWKAYHIHHWLKPVCWIYQLFRYAKQGFKSGRNSKQLKDDFDRSNNRYELLKKLEIN